MDYLGTWNRLQNCTKAAPVSKFFSSPGDQRSKFICKTAPNPCCGSPPVYQDLSTLHDWPVKNAIVDLPIRVKENSKHSSGNSLSLLRAQNKDLGISSQTILTRVKLRL